ncbi:YifB family Mg chelatase-like AAA ATPase [Chitinivibrio alkaliphilus]|uniref:Mg chelatase-related protein n=1 Tax=Chitinivibrio alkaliphilus ACht1 TaxID=1313304 RepID=U7D7E6_9BACT|nr:YifB family Mg chelatase-like AAA ATPase [Chitinivibrio alkaliphilus]ERP38875.1 Mg chelatase-related protein [Chitinivibrio alkaliphilus ACht1]
MLSHVYSMALLGLDAFTIKIETDITEALPSFTIVGLPDGAVRESRERVMSAIKNCGFEFPARKVTINMAPADIRKEGSAYDLPIAVGILIASGQVHPHTDMSNTVVIGELSLDGSIKKITGCLPISLGTREQGFSRILLGRENAEEASVAEGIDVVPLANLLECVQFIEGTQNIPPCRCRIGEYFSQRERGEKDFIDVKGQEHVKRAITVAAAGNHNILMIGPPGSGKTMIARRIPSILPPLTLDESLETTKIHSVAQKLDPQRPILTTRPFRSPHHTISYAGLTGGGSYPRPGEISLSHNGVLFLDELPEFNKNVLENLRQPLEDQQVTISRSSLTLTYPSNFMLIAAMNPCPCGYYGDTSQRCTCTPTSIARYISKISGPLLDRIDIHIEVPALPYEELKQKKGTSTSQQMQQHVEHAKKIQGERFAKTSIHSNASMEPQHMRTHCDMDESSSLLLKKAMEKLGLSARAYDRIIKVSRTIADLAGSPTISSQHVSEAIQYRTLDRRRN